jgi:hypothetical protein
MNKNKSNLLSGIFPCGPGSSPHGLVTFSEDALNILNNTKLIDKKLLKKIDKDLWSYSLSNLK